MKDTLKSFFSLCLREHCWQYLFLLILLLLNIGFSMLSLALVIPFVHMLLDNNFMLKWSTEFGISQNVFAWLLIGGLVFGYLIKNVFSYFFLLYQSKFQSKFAADISIRLYDTYLFQKYSFHLKKDTGKIISTVTTETSQFSTFLTQSGIFMTESMTLVGVSFFLFYLNFLFSLLVVVGFTAVLYFYMRKSRDRSSVYGEQRRVVWRQITKLIIESLTGIKDVKLFSCEKKYKDRFRALSKDLAKSSVFLNIYSQGQRFIFEVFALSILLFSVGIQISLGTSTSEILVLLSVFGVAFMQLIPSLNRFTQAMTTMKFTLPAVQAINEVLINQQNDIEQLDFPEGELQTVSFHKEITLKDISFMYSKEKIVLEGINLCIPKGKKIAIIGPSGVGKTTLVDMICGFYEPTSGEIVMDGISRKELSLTSWRRLFGYVPQSIYLVDETIEYNIAFGTPKKEIDNDQVWKCLELANLKSFVQNLPAAEQTFIGENGVRLSGGQRQRLGIARALYRNPQIIVFDEATSALDTNTEREVLEAINKSVQGRTLVTITHRLSTVQEYDIIFDLEKENTLIKR
jgi:ABC-type multidrug transport system fused ATPase/permease subunit